MLACIIVEIVELINHLSIGNKILPKRLIYTVLHLGLVLDFIMKNSVIALDFLLVIHIGNQVKDILFMLKKRKIIFDVYCLLEPFLLFIAFLKYIDDLPSCDMIIIPFLVYINSVLDSIFRTWPSDSMSRIHPQYII